MSYFYISSQFRSQFIKFLVKKYVFVKINQRRKNILNLQIMKDCDQKVSSFLIKLLNMLRSKQNAKTITWDGEENGIRILNQQKLESVLLPRYFRHNRFSSFVRQLNMYDFHKVYLPDNSSIFYHEVFNPRDKQSVQRIKRKAPPSNDENSQISKKNKVKASNVSVRQAQNEKNEEQEGKKQQLKSKSSFKLLFRNSIGSFNDRKDKQVVGEQILQQIIAQIAPLNLSKDSIRQKISQLRKYTKFKKFLKSSSFLQKIYSKLGIQMDGDDDKLSELSIQEQLMFNTKKSLTLRSLKMFQSGPINLRDTLGMFMN